MYELVTSTVVQGKKLWRTIWFPTLNCPIDDDTFQLPAGTYRVNVQIEWIIYKGIGPWFAEQRLFEVHLLDFGAEVYTKEIEIIPLTKIRDNKTFTSISDLQQQLKEDLKRAQEHPQTVITFGTFDYFHPGHSSYLQQAKKYGDYLITIVARDETVNRIKWHYPDHDEEERFRLLTEQSYIDIVELGNSEDPYTCLRDYTPQVICLWYDQHSFDSWLRERCTSNWLSWTTILRLPSYEPEKRKSSYLKHKK
jgi:cytidyltransferase-like protein